MILSHDYLIFDFTISCQDTHLRRNNRFVETRGKFCLFFINNIVKTLEHAIFQNEVLDLSKMTIYFTMNFRENYQVNGIEQSAQLTTKHSFYISGFTRVSTRNSYRQGKAKVKPECGSGIKLLYQHKSCFL